MPCPFTGSKMFCAGTNILCQHKNLTAFGASSRTFVAAQKPILLNANHLFVWQKIFVTATICKWIFGLAQKVWTSPKYFGVCKRTRQKFLEMSALSFYRSQNVLCRSKSFVSDQKFIYILCQSQTFCARQIDDLHSVKLVFVPAQKFLEEAHLLRKRTGCNKRTGWSKNSI